MGYQINPVSTQGSQYYIVEIVSSKDPVQFENCSQDVDFDIQFSSRCNANSS